LPFPDRTIRGSSAVRTLLAALLLGAAAAPVRGQSVRLTVPEENFRKEPRVTSGNRLATVLEGAVLHLEGRDGRWNRVTLEGWIWKPSVAHDERQGMDLVVSKAGGENLREAPDAGARRLAILERGMLLDSLETSGGWVRVQRTAWIWSGSVSEVAARPGAEDGTPPTGEGGPAEDASGEETAPSAAPSLPDRLVVADAPVRLFVSPEGDTVAVLHPGADVSVLARQGEWARVRIEGWVWEPSTLPSDSAAATDSLTAADLRANPEQYVGRRVRWSLQYVSLERAEPVRTDFYEGEPFLLARPLDRSQGFVYVAVPPELLAAAERLRPLQTIEVLGRVRTGRSALMGVPILDLLALR
jgi:hypothetical protein